METIKVEGRVRSEISKKATKSIRSNGNIPCVMYGGEEVVHFEASPKAFKHAIYTPAFKLVDIEIGGKVRQCIIKDIQFHPVTENVLHLDLLELVPEKGFNAQIPVTYQGVSPGEKVGGKLIKKIRRVNVRMTPETMVDKLVVDISKLQLGGSVRVKDLIAVDGVVVTNPPNAPVASVEIPRALKSAEAAAEGTVAEEVEEEVEATTEAATE